MDDAKSLGLVLSNYTEEHYNEVVTGFFLTYILYPFIISLFYC